MRLFLFCVSLFFVLMPCFSQTTPQMELDYALTFSAEGLQFGHDVKVDANGDRYVLAYSYVDQPGFFVLKWDQHGTILQTFDLGFQGMSLARGMTVDNQGNVFVCGWTTRSDFPLVNALKSEFEGPSEAFVLKFNGQTTALEFSTFLGGTNADQAMDVFLTSRQTLVVVGATDSIDFPTVSPLQDGLALQTCFCEDAFLTELTSDGQTIVFSTYLGGTLEDKAMKVAEDLQGNLVIGGQTQSSDFPVIHAFQDTPGGMDDLFVAKINSERTAWSFSSYIGGEEEELIGGLTFDTQGNLIVVGSTRSVSFPTTINSIQPQYVGGINACDGVYVGVRNCKDQFITKLDPGGQQLFGTYLGGPSHDLLSDVKTNNSGDIITLGYTRGELPGTIATPIPGAYITISVLNSYGSQIISSFNYESPVGNSGHGLALVDDSRILFAGADHVPSDLLVGEVRPLSLPTCLDLVQPSGIGMEDLFIQLSNWHEVPNNSDFDMNEDQAINLLDFVLFTELIGTTCP